MSLVELHMSRGPLIVSNRVSTPTILLFHSFLVFLYHLRLHLNSPCFHSFSMHSMPYMLRDCRGIVDQKETLHRGKGMVAFIVNFREEN